jgi:putative thioredoxin
MSIEEITRRWIRSADLEEFDLAVLQASQQHAVLVDFWAEWCAPCLVIAPVLVQVIEQYAGAVTLVKVEVDIGDNMRLAGQYQVRGFPTLLLFREGAELGRFSGAKTATYIHDFLDEHDIRPIRD